MPAPAVYILAVIGTVGAAIAFKEFVYEPHIAPAIDRWKAEYQAAKRRREEEAMHEAETVVQMSQRQKKTSDSDSDDEGNPWHHGHGGSHSSRSSRFSKDGLLIRRRDSDLQRQKDVELENLVATEVSEWRSAGTGQVLRQRKNVSEHTMDESIHSIPYVPLSPSRTHIVFDPSSPSTSNSQSRVQSPFPAPTAPVSPLGLNKAGANLVGHAVPPREESVDLIESIAPTPAASSPPVSPAPPAISYPAEDRERSSPLQESLLQQTITQSALLGSLSGAPVDSHTTLSKVSPVPTPVSAYASPLVIPSLSQSYPQELDYEHGLELISPPSSRSESPFSMAEMSPTSGLRALSPLSAGSRPISAFSSAFSSPSPLRMGLGNQSYDAISPPATYARSPFLDPPTSVTNSARSTTYLSFDESSDDGDNAQPYAHLPGSTAAAGAFGSASPVPPSMPRYQPTPVHPAVPSHMYTTTASPLAYAPPSIQSGLGLFPVPAREPRTPAAASLLTPSVQPPVAAGAGAGDPAYFRASTSSTSPRPSFPSSPAASAATASFHAPPAAPSSVSGAQSDAESELSDLDFMSDYQPSEGAVDVGEESDGGWSMAGGSSAAGSPMLGPTHPSVNLTRGGTLRDARADRSSRWA